jgi:hypothetical protein
MGCTLRLYKRSIFLTRTVAELMSRDFVKVDFAGRPLELASVLGVSPRLAREMIAQGKGVQEVLRKQLARVRLGLSRGASDEEACRHIGAEKFRYVNVFVPPGHVVVFSADLVHAGTGYAQRNVRVHYYLDSRESLADGKRHDQVASPVTAWGVYARLIIPEELGAAQPQQLAGKEARKAARQAQIEHLAAASRKRKEAREAAETAAATAAAPSGAAAPPCGAKRARAEDAE